MTGDGRWIVSDDHSGGFSDGGVRTNRWTEWVRLGVRTACHRWRRRRESMRTGCPCCTRCCTWVLLRHPRVEISAAVLFQINLVNNNILWLARAGRVTIREARRAVPQDTARADGAAPRLGVDDLLRPVQEVRLARYARQWHSCRRHHGLHRAQRRVVLDGQRRHLQEDGREGSVAAWPSPAHDIAGSASQ